MKTEKFSFLARIKSFTYAFNGLRILIKEEHNARVHLFAAALVILVSFLLKLNQTEWLFVILAIGLVLSAEIVNTIAENICDFISTEKHPKIKNIKDLSAAYVLISVFTSLVIAALVFIPRLQILVN
ncbi:diacylglycerol kinase family protein [uncultured Draconibacterium sp.]|uniref:diacylglycerol kinase family protein n=1 Tax=uncultured Draconibacterium sp. TaxID=1573823 RepID=UPI003216B756